MNWKRFFVAFTATFVFMVLFDAVFHGKILRDIYRETPGLWRTAAECYNHWYLLLIGEVIVVLMFVAIFTRCCGRGGVKVGFALGVMLAVLYIGASLITFAVQPLPARLIFFWAVGGLIESAIAGSIIGAIYKPVTPRL